MSELLKKLCEIANKAQNSSAFHPVCLQQLRKLYENHEHEDFFEAFSAILKILLKSDYKINNPSVDRMLQFVASFCESFEKKITRDLDITVQESPFLNYVFKLLLQAQDNVDHIVRYRACQMIEKILTQMQGGELSEDLFDDIQVKMLERLKDERESVRLQAVNAIFSLQDPTDPECPVIEALSNQIMCDPSAKVRKLCLEKIGLRPDILEKIILKTRDVNIKVRLAAYTRCSKVPKAFQVIQRQKLIKYGFRDENESIRKYMLEKFVLSWFDSYENDYFKFINSLCLDSDFKDANETRVVVEHVFSALFVTQPHSELKDVLKLDSNKLLHLQDLNFESALYWRCYLDYLRKLGIEEDEFYPELVDLCKYIQQYYKDNNDLALDSVDYFHYQFILQQLFQMTTKYDFGDDFLRQTMNSLISEVLQYAVLEEETVAAILKNLDSTMVDVNDQIKFVCMLVSEISYETTEVVPQQEDTSKQLEISKLKIQLCCLKEEKDIAAKENNFLKAEALKNTIYELENKILDVEGVNIEEVISEDFKKKTDIETLLKCLNICMSLLSSLKITSLNSMLITLKDSMIQELLMHANEHVQLKALKCYSLCCIVDQSTAEIGIHIFCAPIDGYNAGAACSTDALLVAISAVVDLIMLYGTDLIANPTDPQNSFDEQHETIFKGGSSLTSVIQALVDLMQDDNTEVQEHAGHGLCNLLLTGRIQSSAVISRLILKWCCPHSNDEHLLKLIQRIGLTLEKLPNLRDTADELEKAVLPTVKSIIKAPTTSPLASVNVLNIANFLIQLCQTHPERYHINTNLMLTICNDILKRPKSAYNLTYSKMLLMLPLEDMDPIFMRDILAICDEIRDDIQDKMALRYIVKFIATINSLLNQIGVIKEENEDEDKENVEINCNLEGNKSMNVKVSISD